MIEWRDSGRSDLYQRLLNCGFKLPATSGVRVMLRPSVVLGAALESAGRETSAQVKVTNSPSNSALTPHSLIDRKRRVACKWAVS